MGCCSSKTCQVLLLDANGRVGQDYRCTESHETTNDWVSVGLDGSEVASPNGKRLVLTCEQGRLVLANTWKGAARLCGLRAERLRSTTVVTDQVGGKSLQLTTTMDHLPVLAYTPPCNRWTFDTLRWNKQAIRWALADETIQRSFLRTIDEAFSARADLFVLPPTLSLHHWHEEVATMTRSTATEHFGQHTEMTRAGWMTADAWTAYSADNT